MVGFTSEMKERFKSVIGVYVISHPQRLNMYKVGMAGAANDKGSGGSRGVGDRIAQLRTGMFDVDVHIIIKTQTAHQSADIARQTEQYLHRALSKKAQCTRLNFRGPEGASKGSPSEWFQVKDLSKKAFIDLVIHIVIQPRDLTDPMFVPFEPVAIYTFRAGTTYTKQSETEFKIPRLEYLKTHLDKNGKPGVTGRGRFVRQAIIHKNQENKEVTGLMQLGPDGKTQEKQKPRIKQRVGGKNKYAGLRELDGSGKKGVSQF